MSQAVGLAVPVTLDAHVAAPAVKSESVSVDLHAVHSFRFARQRWLAGLDTCVKASLMLIPGVFLLTQISATPNLKVQIAVAGGLLTIGGAAFFIQAIDDFFGGIFVDSHGICNRRGLSALSISWTELERWSLNDSAAKLTDLPSLQIWPTEAVYPRVVIPGGYLSEKDLRTLRRLLEFFAAGKEKVD